MDIWFIIENQMFSELSNYSFEEVRYVFNSAGFYVPEDKQSELISKAQVVKDDYLKKLNEIETYEKTVYCNVVDKQKVPFEKDPTFMMGTLETEIKDNLINLIEEYFDEKTFQRNKDLINKEDKKVVEEDTYSLSNYLQTIRKHIYGFLSIVGYYQRHYNYFISKSDMNKINKQYSAAVYTINKGLGIKEDYYNIFISYDRIDGKKYIDADNTSIISLAIKYLKVNTNELIEIVKIIRKEFSSSFGNGAWEVILEEVGKYIKECKKNRLMKEVK